MSWQRRLRLGLLALLLAELTEFLPLIMLISRIGRIFDLGGGVLPATLIACLFFLLSWSLFCLPLLVLLREAPRPADGSKLAGLGFVLGAMGFLVLGVGLLRLFNRPAPGAGVSPLNAGSVFWIVYSGIVSGLAMYFYAKLAVRSSLREMRAVVKARR